MIHLQAVRTFSNQTQTIEAYDGYIKDGQFYTNGTSLDLGHFRAVLTVIKDVSPPQQLEEETDASMDWVDELERIALSATSPLLRMEDFPRMEIRSEPILFAGEGENV